MFSINMTEERGKGEFFNYYNETVCGEKLFAYGCELKKHWFKGFEDKNLSNFGDFIQEIFIESAKFKEFDNIDIVFDDIDFPYLVCYPKFPWEAEEKIKVFSTYNEMCLTMYETIKPFLIDNFTLDDFINNVCDL